MPRFPRQPRSASPLSDDTARAKRAPGGGARFRRHARHAFVTDLRLLVEEQNERGMPRLCWRETKVTTCDVSRSGFAFRSRRYIHPGTLLHAPLGRLPGSTQVEAVVRHCAYESGGEHRVGAEFVSPNAEA